MDAGLDAGTSQAGAPPALILEYQKSVGRHTRLRRMSESDINSEAGAGPEMEADAGPEMESEVEME